MTETRKIPPAPAGSGRRGARFWRNVLREWPILPEEAPQQFEILHSAVVLMGRIEALTAAILRDGDLIEGRDGPRVHPGVSELRQCSAALGRLVSMLELEDDNGETMRTAESVAKAKGARAQREKRAAAAGSVSDMARDAASARWHRRTGA